MNNTTSVDLNVKESSCVMVVASMVLGLFSDNSHSLDYKLLFLVAFAVVKFEFNHQVR